MTTQEKLERAIQISKVIEEFAKEIPLCNISAEELHVEKKSDFLELAGTNPITFIAYGDSFQFRAKVNENYSIILVL